MMIISRSAWRKLTLLVIGMAGFVLLYETTMLDSRYAARLATSGETSALSFFGSR